MRVESKILEPWQKEKLTAEELLSMDISEKMAYLKGLRTVEKK